METSLYTATCTECSKTFHGARRLDSHIRTVHKDEEECSICHAMVKDLVQHKRRVHCKGSRTTKRPSLCQYCGNSFLKIERHKCKNKINKTPIQPILPAPAPAFADNESSHHSSFTRCLTNVPLPAFYPLPHSVDDSAISPLSLCSAAQMHQLSFYDPWAENESAFRLTKDLQTTPSQMPSQVRSVEMDTMSSAINQSTPFDPTSVPPEIASAYSYRLSSTLSLPLDAISYNQGAGTTSNTGAIRNATTLDHDILLPTIETPDADHPFVEEFDMVGSGVSAMEFENLMNWGIFGEHGRPGFL
ncbi:d0b121fc-329a-4ea3-965d-bf8c5db8276c [Sclerotinia trifoliorum]|uniref:D0b121fc-329a-4ea3-965d-bf8c5db8276c n=1 Tax=Sclerotinia trifoliorum TaxID=28548 RepID=A0A8H2ZRU2_9HELO|nr:d0b121fc-329a-4ea3-965d-bf8c5db8276c [Sclerotinia trifoliorum]